MNREKITTTHKIGERNELCSNVRREIAELHNKKAEKMVEL